MKEIIKITIALAFIIGAYILGYHQEYEKHSAKLDEMKDSISIERANLVQLQDSIGKLKHTIGTLKTKIQLAVPKKEMLTPPK